jgi:hypothetical protein
VRDFAARATELPKKAFGRTTECFKGAQPRTIRKLAEAVGVDPEELLKKEE